MARDLLHARRMQFDRNYREEVILRHAARAVLRLVRPEDKALLQRAMARLSDRSRRLRFHLGRSAELSAGELAYLTELDEIDHLAIIALVGGEAVGVARFVRSAANVAAAEPALTVIDEYQGQGLGRILLARLVAAARERGIDRFDAEVMWGNRAMMRLFRELNPRLVARISYPEVLSVEIPLPVDETPMLRSA